MDNEDDELNDLSDFSDTDEEGKLKLTLNIINVFI